MQALTGLVTYQSKHSDGKNNVSVVYRTFSAALHFSEFDRESNFQPLRFCKEKKDIYLLQRTKSRITYCGMFNFHSWNHIKESQAF